MKIIITLLLVFTSSVLTSCATPYQNDDYDYINKRWLNKDERDARDLEKLLNEAEKLAQDEAEKLAQAKLKNERITIANDKYKLCLANADKVKEQGKQLYDITICHVDRAFANEPEGFSYWDGVNATAKQIVNMWVTSCHLGYKLSCAEVEIYDRTVAENRQIQQAEQARQQAARVERARQARRNQELFDAFSGVVKSAQPKPTTTTNCRPDYVGGYSCKTQ